MSRKNSSPQSQSRYRHLVTSMGCLISSIFLLTGCTATSNQQPAGDVIEQRDAVINFVVNTTEHLDVDGWEARHGVASAQGCTGPNGQDGAAYHFDLSADRGPAHDADAQRVVKYWESLGLEARVVDHGGYPTVYATGGPVRRASFTTDAAGESYRVGAVAHCAPGDAGEVKSEYIERRKDGERFPGDEYVPEENIR